MFLKELTKAAVFF